MTAIMKEFSVDPNIKLFVTYPVLSILDWVYPGILVKDGYGNVINPATFFVHKPETMMSSTSLREFDIFFTQNPTNF